jgi:hypothetical protein
MIINKLIFKHGSFMVNSRLRIYLLVSLLTFFINNQVLAAFAKVVQIRGKVSQLGPGMKHAAWVRKGELLKQDTSLVTRGRSFIKVRILDDGSYVTLGPNGKIVLTKINKKRGSMVSMLKGVMRAKVIKDKKKNLKDPNKIYVKTRTAALGVRGTEFVVVSNEVNNVTSLVTLEGEVAMNKLDTFIPEEDIAKAVKEAVDGTQVTAVKKGRAATSYLHKADVTAPTKVNPIQLIALKKNEELVAEVKKPVEAKPVELTEELKKELYAPDTELEKAKGLVDIPKNGSVVDLSSGIFIPEVDESLKVGMVDANTGAFIPEAGIALDVKKGFVVADAPNIDAKKKAEAKKTVEKLNKVVDYKELPNNYAPGHGDGTPAGEIFAAAPTKYVFKFMAGPQGYEYVREEGDRDERTEIGSMAINFEVDRVAAISSRLSWIATLGLKAVGLDKKEYEPKDENDESLKDDNLGGKLALALRYKVGHDFNLLTRIMVEDDFFPLFGGASPDGFPAEMYSRSLLIPKLELGIAAKISRGWSVEASYIDGFSAENRDIDIIFAKTAKMTWFYQYERWKSHRAIVNVEHSDYFYNESDMRNKKLQIGHEYTF